MFLLVYVGFLSLSVYARNRLWQSISSGPHVKCHSHTHHNIHTYTHTYIHTSMYTRNCEYYIQITHKPTHSHQTHLSAIQITHALCKCNAYDSLFSTYARIETCWWEGGVIFAQSLSFVHSFPFAVLDFLVLIYEREFCLLFYCLLK